MIESVTNDHPNRPLQIEDMGPVTESIGGSPHSSYRGFSLDKIGMSLSLLCAIHCLVTPFIVLALPLMARYYIEHPWFHWLMAVLIVPIGAWAFFSGHRHHGKKSVLWLGFSGLVIVGVVPVFFHDYLTGWSEPFLMIFGSALLISAHWINRKSCACHLHGHQHH